MHSEEVVFVVAGVLVGGFAAQWLGWKLHIPAIVFLLFGGLIAGPITGALQPDETFGDLLFPLTSMAVAVILFEGAMGLGVGGIRSAGRTVWLLLTVGAGVTMAGVMISAKVILGIDWNIAILLGTILVVTGPTVIGPILRAIGLHGRVASILEAEGTLIDPLGAILTVLTFGALFSAEQGDGSIVVGVLSTLGVGVAIGLVAALAMVIVLARYLIPDELQNIFTLAMVIGTYAVANAAREESGLVAVTVLGIALASQSKAVVQHVLEFNETLRILFISGLFVLLGARIEADTLRAVEWRNIVFLAVLLIVVRPVSVWLSTIKSGLSRSERTFLAVTAPRGIVAAAIASIYALRLNDLGIADSQVLVSATFTVIVGSVLISGLASKWIATKLGLLSDVKRSVIVLGANPVSRQLAEALDANGVAVKLIDLDHKELKTARMTGLPTQRGSVLANTTLENAGIQGATSFIAMTSNDELNILACRQATSVLGRRRVFQIAPSRPEHQQWWDLPIGTFARPLFAKDANLVRLRGLVEDGWHITSTRLTEQFSLEAYDEMHPESIPLFIVDAKGNVDMIATDAPRPPRPTETLVALSKPEPPKASGRGKADGEADCGEDGQGADDGEGGGESAPDAGEREGATDADRAETAVD